MVEKVSKESAEREQAMRDVALRLLRSLVQFRASEAAPLASDGFTIFGEPLTLACSGADASALFGRIGAIDPESFDPVPPTVVEALPEVARTFVLYGPVATGDRVAFVNSRRAEGAQKIGLVIGFEAPDHPRVKRVIGAERLAFALRALVT